MNQRIQLMLLLICGWLGWANAACAQTDTTAHAIDQFATYPGGADNFFDYIREHLNYPADAQADSVQGVVYVVFTVKNDGAIDDANVRVDQGVSPSCDAEAIRIIRSAPNWIPASAGGTPTNQLVTFPVAFIWKSTP